jgi:hypothetical protein
MPLKLAVWDGATLPRGTGAYRPTKAALRQPSRLDVPGFWGKHTIDRFFAIATDTFRTQSQATSKGRAKGIYCSWCGRKLEETQGDTVICLGDDGLVYCYECSTAIGHCHPAGMDAVTGHDRVQRAMYDAMLSWCGHRKDKDQVPREPVEWGDEDDPETVDGDQE